MNSKQLFNHIESHKESELVKKLIFRKASFRSEVENFYNINFSYDLSDFDSTRRAKKEKIGETPNELLDLLEPFSEGKFYRHLLKYENVRSIAKKYSVSGKTLALEFGGGIIGIFGTAVSIDSGNLIYTAGSLTLALLSIYALIKNFKNHRKRQNSELGIQFNNLKWATDSASHFMKDNYHTIKNYIEEK